MVRSICSKFCTAKEYSLSEKWRPRSYLKTVRACMHVSRDFQSAKALGVCRE